MKNYIFLITILLIFLFNNCKINYVIIDKDKIDKLKKNQSYSYNEDKKLYMIGSDKSAYNIYASINEVNIDKTKKIIKIKGYVFYLNNEPFENAVIYIAKIEGDNLIIKSEIGKSEKNGSFEIKSKIEKEDILFVGYKGQAFFSDGLYQIGKLLE
jgi:hypothetical protein